MEIQQRDEFVGGDAPVQDSSSFGQAPRIQTYYEKEGRGIEGIVRCAGCKKLVVIDTPKFDPERGCPKCGGRRFNDVKNLSGWEMFLLKIRWINFPDRERFLAEFNRG